jgi:hypothetical protein
MIMENEEERALPPWTWRVLGVAAVGLLLTAVLGIGLISAEVFDPKPFGQLQEEVTPGERALAAGKRQLDWLDMALPPEPFSLRLTAAHAGGERDIGYGIALGGAEANVVVAVSPLGYVAIWEQVDGESVVQMPWQTWPHVHRDGGHVPGTSEVPGASSSQMRGEGEPNELQLDVSEGQLSVRINRELLWEGEWRESASGVGLYLESFGEATRVDFRQLELFDGP